MIHLVKIHMNLKKINKAYKSLIKSVELEMEEYQNKMKNLYKDIKVIEDISYKYDQAILSIFREPKSYRDYKYYLNVGFKSKNFNNYLKNNRLDNAQECLKDEEIIDSIKADEFLKIKNLEKQREEEIKIANNNQSDNNLEEYNELKSKIESCKNQIKAYEKEKQAAIIAKREEIRHNLLNNNMKNGILPLYGERHDFNQVVNNEIVNQIHSDWKK
mgnify:CR=1 FL=1